MPRTIAIDHLQIGRTRGRSITGETHPPLSWTLTAGSPPQTGYEIRVAGRGDEWTSGTVQSEQSLLIEWPLSPLQSRERAAVEVRVHDATGIWSEWTGPVIVEASLLDRTDWRENFISPSPSAEPPAAGARPAYLLRTEFSIPDSDIERVRLYTTAHGVYELELNGRRPTEELLAPGWSSFENRLRFQSVALDDIVVPGQNALGVWLADGWYRGRLGFNGGIWNNYGDDVAVLVQLELTRIDGSVEQIPLTWTCHEAPITSSGLYDGESFDARRHQPGWNMVGFDARSWHEPAILPLDRFPARLEATPSQPVTVTGNLSPVAVERRQNGRIRFDFGQNIAGRLRIRASAPQGTSISLHHAEVLEADELAVRPLRSAPSVDRYTFADDAPVSWAPRFTYHGFRYAEVEVWGADLTTLEVTAEVIHTAMERTGWFDSSHTLLNKLHENTVWGMRGNFVDLPTDCPQRDERLGWTGDIQVFAPAAAFLYDTSPLLRTWLRDLAVEQKPDGAVPNFVPWIECGFPSAPAAAWGDAAVIVPWVLFERTGDAGVLREQYPSMTAWVDLVDELSGGTGLWRDQFQLGDWLDPAAPPEHPGDSRTDRDLVATAYFARSAELLARAADVLGFQGDAARYGAIHAKARSAFQREYTTDSGRLVSDTASALSLALVFDLLDGEDRQATAGRRLIELVRHGNHRIETGFVGTPIICDALVVAGGIDTAYHLLLQQRFPSWLFPVTMGATTIWERWDSMLPDGRINPGEMTSFNHYALGAVIDFLHRTVAGLAPETPGYQTIRVAPQPGGGLTSAAARHRTPFGEAEVSWQRTGGLLSVDVTVPPGSDAILTLPVEGWSEAIVGPGRHHFETAFRPADDDPTAPVRIDPHSHVKPESILDSA